MKSQLKTPRELTILRQHRARLQERNNTRILLEGARDLLPGDELCHLLRQLPEFLEINVAVR